MHGSSHKRRASVNIFFCHYTTQLNGLIRTEVYIYCGVRQKDLAPMSPCMSLGVLWGGWVVECGVKDSVGFIVFENVLEGGMALGHYG